MDPSIQIKSNQILFVTYTWLADVNASVAILLLRQVVQVPSQQSIPKPILKALYLSSTAFNPANNYLQLKTGLHQICICQQQHIQTPEVMHSSLLSLCICEQRSPHENDMNKGKSLFLFTILPDALIQSDLQ